MGADLVLQLVGGAACGVIIWRAEPALNRMNENTHLAVRLAIWMTMIGSVARVWWIANGGVPDTITVWMLIGFAALLSCERRLQVLARRQVPKKKEIKHG